MVSRFKKEKTLKIQAKLLAYLINCYGQAGESKYRRHHSTVDMAMNGIMKWVRWVKVENPQIIWLSQFANLYLVSNVIPYEP